MGSATRRWSRLLGEWAIPDHLLALADEPPWGWPEPVLARMRLQRDHPADTPTIDAVSALAPSGGAVVDVGAGTGRFAVPLARAGYRVTAVEPAGPMLRDLRDAAAGLPVDVVEGRWPEAADGLVRHDVALSAHVVYDVADLGPFLTAMGAAADAIVIECGVDHPWAALAPLYRALHGLERPTGPTSADLTDVVEEVAGVAPEIVRWETDHRLRFADREELLAFYRRRLVLPGSRTAELEELLAPLITVEDGRPCVGDGRREVITMWWRS